MCSLEMIFFSRNYIITEVDYLQCFNLLTSVQYYTAPDFKMVEHQYLLGYVCTKDAATAVNVLESIIQLCYAYVCRYLRK